MFNKIRYIDPSKYLEGGIPPFNDELSNSGCVSQFIFENNEFRTGSIGEYDIGLDYCDCYVGDNDSFINIKTPRESSRWSFRYGIDVIDFSNISYLNSYGNKFWEKYTGFIDCPYSMTYRFKMNSYGESYFAIDGEEVGHTNQLEIVIEKNLSAGIHSIEFYYQNKSEYYYTGYLRRYLYWDVPSSDGVLSGTFSSSLPYRRKNFYTNDYASNSVSFCYFEKIGQNGGKENLVYEQYNGIKFSERRNSVVNQNGDGTQSSPYLWYSMSDGLSVQLKKPGTEDYSSMLYLKIRLKAKIRYEISMTDNWGDGGIDGTYIYNLPYINGKYVKYFYLDSDRDVIVSAYASRYLDYGEQTYSTITMNILPEEDSCVGVNYSYLQSSDYHMVSNDKFSYSFWYKYDSVPNGSLISMFNGEDDDLLLYIKDNSLFVKYSYSGQVIENSLYNFGSNYSIFEKNGFRKHVHLCISKGETSVRVYLDGNLLSDISYIPSPTSVRIGAYVDSYPKVLDGWIKFFRFYRRELFVDEVEKLYEEQLTYLGSGLTWENPLGEIPANVDDNTVYVIRKSSFSARIAYVFALNIDRIAFISPEIENMDGIQFDGSNSFSSCPWISESGTSSVLRCGGYLQSETLKQLIVKGIKIYNTGSSGYLFRLTGSAQFNNSFILFDGCKFSSEETSLETSNSTCFDYECCSYLSSSRRIEDFIVRNCSIDYMTYPSSASSFRGFLLPYVDRVCIENVVSYMSSAGSDWWNRFLFDFSYHSNYATDDTNNYSGYVNSLFMKNVHANVKRTTDAGLMGLVFCPCAIKTYLKDIEYNSTNLGESVTSLCAANGVIHLRGMMDYCIDGINIDVQSSYNSQHAFVEMRTSVSPNVSSNGLNSLCSNISTIVKNVSVVMRKSNNILSAANRTYVNGDANYFYYYSTFAFYGDANGYRIPVLYNISIDSPYMRSMCVSYAKCLNCNVNGNISARYCSMEINLLHSKYKYGQISIWRNAEIKINRLECEQKNSEESVVFYGANNYSLYNGFVYILESNCFIGGRSISSDSNYSDFIVYCPSMVTSNGLYYKGISFMLIPSVRGRSGGGIAIAANCTKNTNSFAFPPKVCDGIKLNCASGPRKIKVYFAHSVLSSENISDCVVVELKTSGGIYNSRIDGRFYYGEENWGSDFNSARYELNFNIASEEIVELRVYYSLASSGEDVLFTDTNIGLE